MSHPAQAGNPAFELFQIAGGIGAGNDCTNRGAHDDIGLDAQLRQLMNNADMRPTAGSSTTEYKRDCGFMGLRHGTPANLLPLL